MTKYFDVYALTDDDRHIVEVYQADDKDQACKLFKQDHADIKQYQRINAERSFNQWAIENKYGRNKEDQAVAVKGRTQQ